MAKKIAEVAIDLVPSVQDKRVKDVMNRIDRIAQKTNSGISRVAGSRGGMLGVGGSLLGVVFNPLTLAVGSVAAIFLTLINTTKNLNSKFQEVNNSLMTEAQKQNKALATMGGNTKENNIMYRVLESQGVNTSAVYEKLNERKSRGDLQAYQNVNNNDFITALVNQARGMGVTDGKKYLEEMGLSDLEPLLYSQSNIKDLKEEVVTQAKKNGDSLQGSNVSWNAKQSEIQSAIDFTRTSDQSQAVKKTVMEAGNVVKDNELATLKSQYEALGDAISKATIGLSNLEVVANKTSVSLWTAFVDVIKSLGSKEGRSDLRERMVKLSNERLEKVVDPVTGKTTFVKTSRNKDTDESRKN